ncbi:MAG: hypothetical protein NC177_12860 [Ruminococcus flavefaciens]|nr:hypothetical protein [Ruminococcus flavefaciens]
MKVTLSLETSISPINAINKTSNNSYSLLWSLINTAISDDKSFIKDETADISENDTQAIFSDEDIKPVISYEKVYPVSEMSINKQEIVKRDISMNQLNYEIKNTNIYKSAHGNCQYNYCTVHLYFKFKR